MKKILVKIKYISLFTYDSNLINMFLMPFIFDSQDSKGTTSLPKKFGIPWSDFSYGNCKCSRSLLKSGSGHELPKTI